MRNALFADDGFTMLSLFPSSLSSLPLLAASGTTSKPTSSGGSAIFLIFLLLIVGVYFLFIAPQRRKMRAQMNQQAQFDVGDEVVTKSGLFGTVRGSDGDRVHLEIAPGTTIAVMQASIARRVESALLTDDPVDEDDEAAVDEDDEDGASGEYEEHETAASSTGEQDGEAPSSGDRRR